MHIGGIHTMELWSPMHIKTLLPALIVMLLVSIALRTLLGKKDAKIRMIPVQIIAVLLLVLEVGKHSSGVGKSSLVNALTGKPLMAVSGIREDDAKGRHTTTHRQLLRLPGGALVIDTPGMRELGMWETDTGLGEAFSDVEAYLGRCRFSDCSHTTEPGCAIRSAIAAGELDPGRWERYQKLKDESVDRDELLRRKREWSKGVAKFSRNRNKEVW